MQLILENATPAISSIVQLQMFTRKCANTDCVKVRIAHDGAQDVLNDAASYFNAVSAEFHTAWARLKDASSSSQMLSAAFARAQDLLKDAVSSFRVLPIVLGTAQDIFTDAFSFFNVFAAVSTATHGCLKDAVSCHACSRLLVMQDVVSSLSVLSAASDRSPKSLERCSFIFQGA